MFNLKLPPLSVIGALAGLALLVGLGVAGKAFLDRARADHGQAVEYAACQAVAAGKAAAKPPGEACARPIAEALVEAFRSRACEAGLRLSQAADSAGRWAAPTVCSRKVQDLAASNNVALDTVDARDGEILRLRGSMAASLARAEARGALKARRMANAQAAIAAAPRNDAGLIVCSGRCLRQLAGEDGGPGPDRDGPPDD